MRIKLAIAVLLQMLILLSIVAYKQYIITTGERILLETRSFDPRDLLKGDYVRLSYEISSLNAEKFGAGDKFKAGDTIYVTLGKNANGTFSPLTFGKTAPKGVTFIKGNVLTAYNKPTGTITVKDDSGVRHEFEYYWPQYEKDDARYVFCVGRQGRLMYHFLVSKDTATMCQGDMTKVYGIVEQAVRREHMEITAEYGIENFFVEEGKGRNIESAIGGRGVEAVIYLSKEGKGVLKTLIVNGKELS